MTLREYIHGMRLRTLPLGAAPVIAGTALSYADRALSSTLFWTVAVLCLCVAVFLQISANFANDYSDGIRGTDIHRAHADDETAQNSAPSRLVAAGVQPRLVLIAAAVNAVIACAAGLAVTILTGHWWFIALGAVCLLAGWYYVGGRHPYGYCGLGEIAVFIFFGLVPVLGTAYALSGTITFSGIYTACILGLIAMGVLCINNLRDVDSDEVAGKRTWMVMTGRTTGTRVTTGILVGAIVLVTLPWCNLVFPGFTDSFGSLVWFFAAMLCLIAGIDLIVRAIAATHQRQYRVALPICSCASLCFALMLVFAALP